MKNARRNSSIAAFATLLLVATAATAQYVGGDSVGGGGGGPPGTFAGPVTYSCEALTYAATVNIDFSTKPCKTVTIAGDVTFTTSNLAASAVVTLLITNDLSYRFVTFPAWTWLTQMPTVTGAAGVTKCTLTSTGTTNAAVLASCEGGATPRVVSGPFITRAREDVTNMAPATTLLDTRVVSTVGNFLDVDTSGCVNNSGNDGSDNTLSIYVDGTQAPQSSSSTDATSITVAGANGCSASTARVAITAGTHSVKVIGTYTDNGAGGLMSSNPMTDPADDHILLTTREVFQRPWVPPYDLPQVHNTNPEIIAWWKADAGVTFDGSNRVSSWADQSGNGHDATQSTSGLKPLYVATCQNGRPCIRFDPTRKDALTVSVTQQKLEHIFIVAKHNSQATDPTYTNCTGANCAFIYAGTSTGGNNNKPAVRCDGAYRARTTAAITTAKVFDFHWDSNATSSNIRVNNVEGTADSACNSPGTMSAIGGDDGSVAGLDGDIMEIIILAADITICGSCASETSTQYMHDYLNGKWGIY